METKGTTQKTISMPTINRFRAARYINEIRLGKQTELTDFDEDIINIKERLTVRHMAA